MGQSLATTKALNVVTAALRNIAIRVLLWLECLWENGEN